MAKTSTTKAKDKKPSGKKAETAPAAEAVRQVAKKARVLANNPVVTEVVAATLVAAAAALKNPAKARALADSAADELKEASKGSVAKTGAFWQMAMEIARRSVDALGTDSNGTSAPKKSAKAPIPKAAKKPAKAERAAKTTKVKKAKKAKKA